MSKEVEFEDAINTITNYLRMKPPQVFCRYKLCMVRYFEHYHIDEHTVTFLREKMIDGKKEVSF